MIRTAAAIAGVALATMTVGCKKNVDLSAADTGPAPSAAVATAPATAEAVDAAPLQALASAAPVAVKKVAPKDAGAADAAPAAAVAAAPATPSNLPECSNARTFCSSPKVGTDAKIKKMCDSFTAECKAKGGSL
jgi:hypothetical protein